jgi:peptide deformylase
MAPIEVIPDTDPYLRKTSKRIRHVDDSLRNLLGDMYETMVENWGIGLAAVQVGSPRRVFIYEIPRRNVKGYETCKPHTGQDEQDKSSENEAEEENSDESDEESPNAGYSGDYYVCINPRILSREGAFIDDEGCLSRSGWLAKVERAIKVTFEAYDINMQRFERTVEGLEARCVQHEIDHLDGILFTDRAIPGTLREVKEDEEDEEEEKEEEIPEPSLTDESTTEKDTSVEIA